MAEHMPGKLRLVNGSMLVGDHPFRVADVSASGRSSAEMEANARRLAAAWNAVHDAGLTTEALEAGAVKATVEACKHVVAEIEANFSVTELVTSESMLGGFVDMLRAALTKGA